MTPQVWERRVPGSDVAVEKAVVDVRPDGFVKVEESLLAQLLLDAGWERAQ